MRRGSDRSPGTDPTNSSSLGVRKDPEPRSLSLSRIALQFGRVRRAAPGSNGALRRPRLDHLGHVRVSRTDDVGSAVLGPPTSAATAAKKEAPSRRVFPRTKVAATAIKILRVTAAPIRRRFRQISGAMWATHRRTLVHLRTTFGRITATHSQVSPPSRSRKTLKLGETPVWRAFRPRQPAYPWGKPRYRQQLSSARLDQSTSFPSSDRLASCRARASAGKCS